LKEYKIGYETEGKNHESGIENWRTEQVWDSGGRTNEESSQASEIIIFLLAITMLKSPIFGERIPWDWVGSAASGFQLRRTWMSGTWDSSSINTVPNRGGSVLE
jgi:hypothetical protein